MPQRRERPERGRIALVFHRFPAEDGAEPGTPPIVRLHGGPGFGGLEEAMDALPAFREQVLRFLRTGETEEIPDRVQLPPVDWVVPAELPAASGG